MTEVVAEQIEFVGSKNDTGSGSGRQDYQNNNNASAGSGLGLGEEIVFDDNDLPF